MTDATQSRPKSHSIVQWGLVVVLTALVAIAVLPNYFSGQWPGSNELPVPHIAQLRGLLTEPLEVPGWESTFHQEVNIGRNRWTIAEYRRSGVNGEDESFGLLLRPQQAGDQQPEVEWVDLQGAQSWQVDNRHAVPWLVESPTADASVKITTRYLRGIDERNTFAVMQWYAWPSGGHFAPGKWFWADQAQQWQHSQRLPWVAVSILLPIDPVGDIRTHTAAITEIAQSVQQGLLSSTFRAE
ncbi:MAG: cyanoexosortase B system-associated protein [Leptolyngbya sp. SIOISBB]|nr:cyanoexosortase B system-associated protein [Leptolyngbya sp. SIOISBB]